MKKCTTCIIHTLIIVYDLNLPSFLKKDKIYWKDLYLFAVILSKHVCITVV